MTISMTQEFTKDGWKLTESPKSRKSYKSLTRHKTTQKLLSRKQDDTDRQQTYLFLLKAFVYLAQNPGNHTCNEGVRTCQTRGSPENSRPMLNHWRNVLYHAEQTASHAASARASAEVGELTHSVRQLSQFFAGQIKQFFIILNQLLNSGNTEQVYCLFCMIVIQILNNSDTKDLNLTLPISKDYYSHHFMASLGLPGSLFCQIKYCMCHPVVGPENGMLFYSCFPTN